MALIGLVIACLPAALIIYFVGKSFVGHMVEENTPGCEPWEVRSPNSVEGLPHDIRKHH